MNEICTDYSDRRKHSRIEIVSPVLGALGEGDMSVTCRLRDISLSGVRLTIDHPVDLTRETLEFMVEGVRITAEIVWRSVRDIGLRFVDPAGALAVRVFEAVITSAYAGEARRMSHC